MDSNRCVFQIHPSDNVATALTEVTPGPVEIRGAAAAIMTAVTDIPVGHKIALSDIAKGEEIVKYGITIGRATQQIAKGSWVHLHCMESIYDQRSSHLDVISGAPKDIKYE